MGRTLLQQAIVDRREALRASVGLELTRVRTEEGLSMRAMALAAGVDASHLSRIEAGEGVPSLDVLAALATAAGHRVSLRLYPTDGPRIRDRLQAPMIEALLRGRHPRWGALLEVGVYRPVRGVIDVVLRDQEAPMLVAGEGHSQLNAVERQLRWAGEKADSLPSAVGWPWRAGSEPITTSRLLLVRSCRAMHDLVRTLPETFATAYPADPREAVAALRESGVPWPGAAMLWVTIDGHDTRLIDGLPRNLR